MRRLTLLGLIVLALAVLARPQPPARAAFPGANGKIAFVSDRDGNYEIYAMNADGSGQTNLTNNPALDTLPIWSPDGSKIAFASDRDGNFEIYMMDADGTGEMRVTDNLASDSSPAWSPDGSEISFSSDRDGNAEIYVMNADGSDVTRLTDDPAGDDGPAWSPDGVEIAFTRQGASTGDVYVMSPDGSNLTNLTHTPVYPGVAAFSAGPNWSPDASRIVYWRLATVFVMRADGSNVIDLGDGYDPSWSPDGSAIVFEKPHGEPGHSDCFNPCEEIYVMKAQGSEVRRLTNNNSSDTQPDWQPRIVGDADCHGGANAVDAELVLQLDARLIDSLACADLADVNNDGRIDSEDAELILQYGAGLIEQLPGLIRSSPG